MPAYKDEKRGNWYAAFYYENWKGERQKKMKRGFKTRKAAQEWERQFLLQKAADMNMEFERFVELYREDKLNRLKENTLLTKENIIQLKILPYFRKKKMCDIQTKDVIEWQNTLLACRDEKGKPYSQSYLKTIHNQLSAIFNHAVRYYGLKSNPAAIAGNMGKEGQKEMLYWTKEEYLKFADAVMDKPVSYYAFEILYWCGIREGELLALFLMDEIKDYLASLYGIKDDQRIFEVTKSYLHHEMDRGAKEAGVKRIRIHDLRHPYVKHTTKIFVFPYALKSWILYVILMRLSGNTVTRSMSRSMISGVRASAFRTVFAVA